MASAAAAFTATLYDNLVTRLASSFPTVKVSLAGEAGLALNKEAVVLIRPDAQITGRQEWAAMGKRKDDSFTLPPRIYTYKAGTQNSTNFKVALDRCADLLDEVIAEVRDSAPNLQEGTWRASVTDIAYAAFLVEGGWAAQCDFNISADVRLT